MITYELSSDGNAITCLVCGMTSWNPTDIEQKYCQNCHLFHSQMALRQEIEDGPHP
jgi:hypothetical protein